MLSDVEQQLRAQVQALRDENRDLRLSNTMVWRYYEQALERANLLERLATTTRRRPIQVTQ